MLTKTSLLIFIFLSIDLALSFDIKPAVTTNLGRIEGFYRELHPGGTKYEAYQGIPYALSPNGNRRFSPPEPIEPWKDTLLANKLGNMCMQHMRYVDYVRGDEDCLYLNVYAPLTIRRENQSLPVIVLIHGGAFQYWNGDLFLQPHYLVKEDVILVGMNYRLGSLGFLSTEDDVIPGNMGLKDQSMALLWVKTHIQAFGGDPKKVTIVGLSAGAASVHYHYLSRMSAGLFRSGMSFSGTALDCWTQTENSREKAMRLAELVNCPTGDVKKMIECMRELPAKDIVAAQTKFMPWQGEPFTPFGPVVEKPSKNAFIDRPPIEIITSGDVNNASWVTGVVSGDGLYPVVEFALKSEVLEELDKNWESIAPHLLDYKDTIPVEEHANVARKIRQHYLEDKPINNENLKHLIRMVGDRIYIVDAGKAVKAQAKANPGKVWLYYYSYRAATSLSNLLTNSSVDFGVCHSDDYLLTIGNPYIDPVKRKNDLQLNKELIQFWLHVARTGIPELGSEWTPVDGTTTELNYLHVKGPGQYSMQTDPNFGQKSFWNSIDFNENKVA